MPRADVISEYRQAVKLLQIAARALNAVSADMSDIAPITAEDVAAQNSNITLAQVTDAKTEIDNMLAWLTPARRKKIFAILP